MPCFLLWTKHKEMANELHDRIQKPFPDVDKNVDSNNIEKFTLPNESCGSEITHILASSVKKTSALFPLQIALYIVQIQDIIY